MYNFFLFDYLRAFDRCCITHTVNIQSLQCNFNINLARVLFVWFYLKIYRGSIPDCISRLWYFYESRNSYEQRLARFDSIWHWFLRCFYNFSRKNHKIFLSKHWENKNILFIRANTHPKLLFHVLSGQDTLWNWCEWRAILLWFQVQIPLCVCDCVYV